MPATTTPSGLVYEDIVVGSGAEAKPGQQVSVHYTGWLTVETRSPNSAGSRAAQACLGPRSLL